MITGLRVFAEGVIGVTVSDYMVSSYTIRFLPWFLAE
jgi:hypothetical protein